MLSILPGNLDDTRVVEMRRCHLSRARAETAVGSAHALDVEALRSPDIHFLVAWEADRPVGIGALRRPSSDHAEIKSMYTAEAARGRGVGSTILQHLIGQALALSLTRLSLETGSWEYFRAARRFYLHHGFVECPPFGNYHADSNSVFS